MSWIDKTLRYLAPGVALKRQRDAMLLEVLEKHSKRGYEAASSGRRTDGWQAFYQLPWQEVSRDLPKLRARAIDLANNNPWAKKAIEVVANNTVGSGIMPALPKGRIGRLWKEWAESTDCDYDNLHTFAGLQWQVIHTMTKSGECLVVRRRANRRLGLELQVLEGVYLDQGKNYTSLVGTDNYIVDGVEFTRSGKRVAYWLFEQHPYFWPTSSRRVPAEDVIHLYEVLRPGQVRGVPFGVSAMLRLRDFDEYEDAQLIRQKIAACYTVFVRDSVDSASGVGTDSDSLPDSLEPGLVHKLAPGMDVSFANPPGAEGYSEYSRNILLAISAAWGVPYEALTNDYSNVNFSSSRMSWLEFNRNVTRWQKHLLIPRFCQKVWDWFNQYAVVDGAANTPAGSIQWTPPRREMIDPTKETAAMTEAVRSGFTTWAEAVRANGYEPESQLAEIAEFNAKMDAAGVILSTDARKTTTSGPVPQTAEEGEADTSGQATTKKKPATVKRPQGGGTQPS